eukprot:CAMPEP_0175931024 /NCGR_PEP_ID=MMETSP0108-20121206/18618_1 /TAXON_ID=195067 ORGANISM="Goniomonas pacifica, Strain CCMP1869" /NCGR_SAMPLE_ID=MMETSP0108 /ASSEMBLY_ACC=CAM_ASM_000204 /LENGTH=38 /DNA_ID= /DNA_START= /DNA_END= /DNA_ORIENTATION=
MARADKPGDGEDAEDRPILEEFQEVLQQGGDLGNHRRK